MRHVLFPLLFLSCVVAIPAQSQSFTDVTTLIGLPSDETPSFQAAWGDYDNDGDPDLFVTNGSFALDAGPSQLFRNDAGIFTVVTAAAGDFGQGKSFGAAWGDHDNDGDLDLYINRGGSVGEENFLMQKNADGTFTNIAPQAGVDNTDGTGINVCWADFDQDGFLDLLVIHNPQIDAPFSRLHRNRGDGTYEEIFAGMGLQVWGFSAACGDYDNDGDPDFFLANVWDGVDPSNQIEGNNTSRLYRNDGESFTDITAAAGLSDTGISTGVAWGDYDNDDDLDLYINVNVPSDGRLGLNYLYRNDGGSFTNIASQAGVADRKEFGVGNTATWGDYDNDGWLDLFVTNVASNPNRLYQNQGDGTFVDQAAISGITQLDGVGAAWADYDKDGDLDLYIPRTGLLDGVFQVSSDVFYRNDGTANRWLHIALIGTASNRAAIGARVIAIAGDLRQLREVDGGSGLYSQNSLDLEFGLGQRTSVDSLIVRWPSGTVQVLTDLATNQRLHLVEGETNPTAVAATDDATPSTATLDQNYPNPFNAETVLQFSIPTAGPVQLAIFNLSGQKVATLANQWHPAGRHALRWDGRDDDGHQLASGVFLYRLQTDTYTESRKLLLVQ
ncbi:MAG: T9SS type A sorting domain-containing protein [Candidatus Latescibacteria bacterium]|nr:T9SS type A sorting domain-containing protein [Candidatus Latescibacterota bacterium]